VCPVDCIHPAKGRSYEIMAARRSMKFLNCTSIPLSALTVAPVFQFVR
jgi:hypothetical protein